MTHRPEKLAQWRKDFEVWHKDAYPKAVSIDYLKDRHGVYDNEMIDFRKEGYLAARQHEAALHAQKDALIAELAIVADYQENTPIVYRRVGGTGPIYAIHGTSSINYCDSLEARIAELERDNEHHANLFMEVNDYVTGQGWLKTDRTEESDGSLAPALNVIDSITALHAQKDALIAELEARAEEAERKYEQRNEDAKGNIRLALDRLAQIATLEARLKAIESAEPLRWFNGCNKTVPRALRYLADNPRPIGGSEHFNSEHLYQLAAEIERMSEKPIYLAPPAQPASEAVKVPDGYTPVKTETLLWLLGEAGDFECPIQQYSGAKPSPYFWRSKLRAAMRAPAPKPENKP